jgi:hypothetical protein
MPETATYSHITRGSGAFTLIWIKEPRFQGWGCPQCAWVFNPSGPPVGNSLQEMKVNYERWRDKEFAAHVCAERHGAKKTKLQAIHAAPPRTDRMSLLGAGSFSE